MFEALIGLLVLTVFASFITLLVKVSPAWAHVFRGYVPSSTIIANGGLYIAVGLVHSFSLFERCS
jgi:metal iron transporter